MGPRTHEHAEVRTYGLTDLWRRSKGEQKSLQHFLRRKDPGPPQHSKYSIAGAIRFVKSGFPWNVKENPPGFFVIFTRTPLKKWTAGDKLNNSILIKPGENWKYLGFSGAAPKKWRKRPMFRLMIQKLKKNPKKIDRKSVV